MPRLSDEKIKKIDEQVMFVLYSAFPKMLYTVEVAAEIARDEEFIKTRLLSLAKQGLVSKIDRNAEGIKYERRLRWRISTKAHEVYKQVQ